jgi:hypothetical protein
MKQYLRDHHTHSHLSIKKLVYSLFFMHFSHRNSNQDCHHHVHINYHLKFSLKTIISSLQTAPTHSICSPLLSYQPPILTELEAPGLVQAMWELWHRADHPIGTAEDEITPGHHFLQLHHSIAALLQSLTKTYSRTKVCIPSTLNRSENLVTFFLH